MKLTELIAALQEVRDTIDEYHGTTDSEVFLTADGLRIDPRPLCAESINFDLIPKSAQGDGAWDAVPWSHLKGKV